MKVIITAFTLFSLIASLNGQETNVYESIVKRNAFNLTEEAPMKILPPVSEILAPNVYLTGITRLNGVRKAHLVLRKTGDPDKFVSLAANERQYNIELKKILEDSAYISTNGQHRLLSFEKHALPTIITKSPPKLMQRSDRKDDKKKDEKKSDLARKQSNPNIVTVPSRSRRKSDPRVQQMIEKSLEYVSKIDDPKRREAILERIEKYQRNRHDSIRR